MSRDINGALRRRCQEFLDDIESDADPNRLVEFIVTELGRTADRSLETTLPLVLYFANDKDRTEFIEMARGAKPGMVMKKVGR